MNSSIRPYISLVKPRIVFLLNIVSLTSVTLASNLSPSLASVGWLLLAGTAASAGCGAINSFLDRDIDVKMTRTMKRPIPTGRISSGKALAFGSALLAVGLLSALLLNLLTFFNVALGSFFYLVIYTVWLKRRSTLNIVIGGFAGSAAALAGWSAATGGISLLALFLAVLIFLWTPGHFWALALTAKKDYAAAGIPMLPSISTPKRSASTILLSTVVMVAFSFAPVLLGMLGAVYLVAASVAGVWILVLNYRLLIDTSNRNAWRAFKASGPYLTILLVGMLIDAAL
jgi:protoheme IX farnesyltransferase